MKKLVTGTDFLIILIILSSALLLFAAAPKNAGATASVYVDGEIYKTIDLTKSGKTEIDVNGVTVICENGEVYIKNSTCHDKICVNTGRLSKTGQCAVCVPNKVFVAVNGNSENLPWAVTG